MHITILTQGSRGDVQPYLALGIGLRQAGYEVCLATNALFEPIIRQHGLAFMPLPGDIKAIHQSKKGQQFLHSGSNPFALISGFQYLIKSLVDQTVKSCWEACRNTDAIIAGSFFLGPVAYVFANHLNIPFIYSSVNPLHPTTLFPSILFPTPFRKIGILNFLTHWLGFLGLWQATSREVNSALKDVINYKPSLHLILEIYRRQPFSIYGWSPSVLPKPKNWEEEVHLAGYWFLQGEEWTPPKELSRFLAAGSPPVYVGFGSMVNHDAADVTKIILAALKKSGQRGILLTGWGGVSQVDLPDEVFIMEKAPHDWLFPRMAAVVHHGGVGTTGAALRAGVPSIVIPHFFDQPLWADRVFELGVGPRPIPRKQLSVERLAAAITTAVTDQQMRQRAARLGEQIRSEKGVEKAVEIITRYLEQNRAR